MKYFKQSYKLGILEWTSYGSYEDSDITQDNIIDAIVYSVDCDNGKYYYECYEALFDSDKITEITEKEYRYVVEQLQKVDELQAQFNKILKSLL